MKEISLATILTLCSLPAQTYIVDINGGAGTNFTSMQNAVNTVPDGATLLVRPGQHDAFSYSNKGLTILCDAAVTISGAVHVSNTAANQPNVLRGVTWLSSDVSPNSTHLFSVSNCAGPVLIEGTTAPQALTVWFVGPGFFETSTLLVHDSAQVTVRDCELSGRNVFGFSNVSLESCQVTGDMSFGSPQAAISHQGGFLQISGTSVIKGGPGSWISAGLYRRPAFAYVGSSNAVLRVVGGELSSQQGTYPVQTDALALPAGTASADPRALIAPSPPPSLSNFQVLAMPMVTATGGTSPGTISATAAAEPGDLIALVLGLPGLASQLPGIDYPLWVEPGAAVVEAVGVHSAANPVAATLGVPGGLAGSTLTWHAVAFGPVTGAQVSNPATSLVH